jgi:F-type H+-transporting ATPase subunit alpha
MENKHADLLLEFKKGNLPEEGLKQMVALAKSLMEVYKA